MSRSAVQQSKASVEKPGPGVDNRFQPHLKRGCVGGMFSRFSTASTRSSSVPRRLRIAASPSTHLLVALRETVESFEKLGLTVANGFVQLLEAVLHLGPQYFDALVEATFESFQVSLRRGHVAIFHHGSQSKSAGAAGGI
jgi:hypothetical protein